VRALHRTAASLVAVVVAGTPLALVTPASAAARTATAGISAAAIGPCLTDLATRVRGERDVPHWRKHDDTGSVSQSDLEALPRRETRPAVVARSVEPRLPDTVLIPVFVHDVTGRHRGERKGVSGRRIRNLINILNNGMAGRQSSLSVTTRYRFTLRKIDRTRRDSWFHAFFNGPRDRKMKRRLHRGNARTLNLYLNGGGPRNNPVLGWARFPWQYETAPKLDGVSLNVASLPGGRATYYNLGDTVIHETGHWLGLFHTFENGCGEPGDLVADTAAEDQPSFYCETTRDTCTEDPGLDPVRNFMDYSRDSCMNMFTAGQVRRMDSAFERWRY
jgi:hypothetical protein